jgi:DNA-directed RNA polymerase subunit M/transcription elongation factor TFIIS
MVDDKLVTKKMATPEIYERISRVNKPKWILAQVLDDLETKNVDESYVIDKLDANGYGFNHPTFDELRRKQREQDDYISAPYEVEEGVVQCGKCGSKRVFSSSVQTRAADEPMTTIAFCVECKNRWTQNG